MTEEIRNDEVETSTDEVVNEIVEETLEEAEASSSVKAKGSAKDASPVSEPESIASVDKAADAVKPKQAPAPKTKAGMISAMTDKMLKMSKTDMESMYQAVRELGREFDTDSDDEGVFLAGIDFDKDEEAMDALTAWHNSGGQDKAAKELLDRRVARRMASLPQQSKDSSGAN